MITLDKLKIYKRYDGDIDTWVRSGKPEEKNIMDTNDWYLIDSIIQDLIIEKRGNASMGFKIALSQTLLNNCHDKVIINLKKMAGI